MRRVCVLAAVSIAVCAGLVSSAYASKEFIKVGDTVKAEVNQTLFEVDGGGVNCASNKAEGKVASKTEVDVTVTYSECEAYSEAEFEVDGAKVEPCKYIFYAPKGEAAEKEDAGSVTLNGGCVITAAAGLCTITPSTTENKELGKVLYNNDKETGSGEELESEIYAAPIENITYKASAFCLGVESGHAGKMLTGARVTGVTAPGAQGGRNEPRFRNTGSATYPRILSFHSTSAGPHTFAFPEGSMICKDPTFRAGLMEAQNYLMLGPAYIPDTCELTNGKGSETGSPLVVGRQGGCDYIADPVTGSGTSHKSEFSFAPGGCFLRFREIPIKNKKETENKCWVFIRSVAAIPEIKFTNFLNGTKNDLKMIFAVGTGINETSNCYRVTESTTAAKYTGAMEVEALNITP